MMFIHCADSFHKHNSVRPCPAVLHICDLTEIFNEYSRFKMHYAGSSANLCWLEIWCPRFGAIAVLWRMQNCLSRAVVSNHVLGLVSKNLA